MDNMIVAANVKMLSEISQLERAVERERKAKDKYRGEIRDLKKQLKKLGNHEINKMVDKERERKENLRGEVYYLKSKLKKRDRFEVAIQDFFDSCKKHGGVRMTDLINLKQVIKG